MRNRLRAYPADPMSSSNLPSSPQESPSAQWGCAGPSLSSLFSSACSRCRCPSRSPPTSRDAPGRHTLAPLRVYPCACAAPDAGVAEFPGIILEAGETYGIDPFVLVRLIQVESTFERQAVSSVGAIGRTQFLPATIRSYGMSVAHFRDSLHCQVTLAARYLADLTRRYGSQDLVMLPVYQDTFCGAERESSVPPPISWTRG